MLAIEVQLYGDFDIPVTVAVMVAPEGWSKSLVSTLSSELERSNANVSEANAAIKELERMGFVQLKTISLTVGGNL